MNTRIKIALAAAGLVLVAGAAVWHHHGHPGLGGDHSHAHGEHASNAQLALNNGQKWKTDAPLQTGMKRMHDAVVPALKAHRAGSFSDEQSRQLARTLRNEIDGLFKACKLEPEADAMLHIVLAEILAGTADMEKDPQSANGLPKIASALHAYADHFEPAGF